MNNVFTAKLLQNLNNKKGNKGFTLIELLVVVIIIGVLAAVALPNLLAQVGKARETEGKNAVGTLNRSQQAYHFEATRFSPSIADTGANGLDTVTNPLGVAIDSPYYTFTVTGDDQDYSDPANPPTPLASVTASAGAVAAAKDGVRNYGGATAFNDASGLYGTVLCQGTAIGASPTPAAAAGGTGACGATGIVLK